MSYLENAVQCYIFGIEYTIQMYGPAIKNIIFDFGGVILDLNTSKTHEAFGKIAGVSGQSIKDTLATTAFFNDYEKGLLTDQEFRTEIRSMLNTDITNEQLDAAWNVMLEGIPVERLRLLETLGKKHKTFLLSNTNNIHLQFFNGIVQKVSGRSNLDPFFHKTYYSHLMKMRKPDVEIFEHVLRENELLASETLFLDDNMENLRGAERAGLKTAHVPNPDSIFSIFA
jgi:FMN phosphatase YigB (HAD superfamily)